MQNSASQFQNQNAGSSNLDEPAFLAIAKVRKPHGLKGEVKLDLLTDFPERYKEGTVLYYGKSHHSLTITSVRQQGESYLFSFAELSDSESASVLTNQILYVRNANRPKLPKGQYYQHKLLGIAVFDQAGNPLGTLTEVISTGANDVFVIKDDDGKEILIPAIHEVIQQIDTDQKRMIIQPQIWE